MALVHQAAHGGDVLGIARLVGRLDGARQHLAGPGVVGLGVVEVEAVGQAVGVGVERVLQRRGVGHGVEELAGGLLDGVALLLHPRQLAAAARGGRLQHGEGHLQLDLHHGIGDGRRHLVVELDADGVDQLLAWSVGRSRRTSRCRLVTFEGPVEDVVHAGDGRRHVGHLDAGAVAPVEGGELLEHADEHRGRGQQEEVVGRRRVDLLLAEPADLAVARVERLLVGADDVRRLGDAGHHAPAEVLPRVADVGQLPVDEHVGAVLAEQHVGDLEVAVHQTERHRRRAVGLEVGGDQPHERVAVDVLPLGVDPVLDAGVDVVVPRRRDLEARRRLVERERSQGAADLGQPRGEPGQLARVALAPDADERLAVEHVDDDARAAELLAGRIEPQRRRHRDPARLVQRRQHLPLRWPGRCR